jgi:restriction system protein
MMRNKYPWNPDEPFHVTPPEYEQQVRRWLVNSKSKISKFKVAANKKLDGPGGYYQIDVLVSFVILGGARVSVLVECKHHKRPVRRDDLLILDAKLRTLHAHKGMIFSTSGFQAGAVKYAKANGIATITLRDGFSLYETFQRHAPRRRAPAWAEVSPIVGQLVQQTDGGYSICAFDDQDQSIFNDWLQGFLTQK